MKTVNGAFNYKVDSWSSRWSCCFLRVYQVADRINVVIATELTENQGPSITNSAEALATEVVKEYDLDPERTYFVEHYDHRTSALRDRADTTYDFVEFTWQKDRETGRQLACCAKWKHAGKDAVEKLVGEEIE